MMVAWLLTPLIDAMMSAVPIQLYLQPDETIISVLPEKGKEKKNLKAGSHLRYFGVFGSPELNLPFFIYKPGRGQECPKDVLRSFSGFFKPTVTNQWQKEDYET